ncbi:MAG: hypothetical protein H7267_09175 [Sandarakinorhabdus sp.]|nr:hypothetical protein [Sandarakinorhabdus sp.]
MQGAAGTTIICCGLTPAGWHALTGGRLLTNALMPLPFADAERMTAMVSRAADTRSMVATVGAWLVAHLAGAAPDARIASIDAWIIDDGIAYIDDLAGALSL